MHLKVNVQRYTLVLYLGAITLVTTQASEQPQPGASNYSFSKDVFPQGLPKVKTGGPDASHVFVESHGNSWSLSELYENAAIWLVQNKHIPDEVRTNAAVWFYPENKDVMCCFAFHYAKLIGRPVWQVDMGYDGKVAACRQYTASHSMPPGMSVPPPPRDPYEPGEQDGKVQPK